jgi:hypothetical protein
MTTTGFAGLSMKKNELIRKGLTGAVFIAPTTAPAITAANLFDVTTGALVNPLPAGYRDLGFLSAAGAAFSRTVKTSDITSWQSLDPTRTDITSDKTQLVIIPQETNQSTIGLYLGIDSSTVVPAANGSFEIDRPDVSTPRYYRILVLAVDQADAGELVIARFFPRGLVTAFKAQTDANDANPVDWGVTIDAYLDTALGYPESYMFGGDGQLSLQVDMGFNRDVTCTVALTTALVATTGEFFPNDVGAVVTGTGIPVGTTIADYVSSTQVTLSAAGTAAGSAIPVVIAGKA